MQHGNGKYFFQPLWDIGSVTSYNHQPTNYLTKYADYWNSTVIKHWCQNTIKTCSLHHTEDTDHVVGAVELIDSSHFPKSQNLRTGPALLTSMSFMTGIDTNFYSPWNSFLLFLCPLLKLDDRLLGFKRLEEGRKIALFFKWTLKRLCSSLIQST